MSGIRQAAGLLARAGSGVDARNRVRLRKQRTITFFFFARCAARVEASETTVEQAQQRAVELLSPVDISSGVSIGWQRQRRSMPEWTGSR